MMDIATGLSIEPPTAWSIRNATSQARLGARLQASEPSVKTTSRAEFVYAQIEAHRHGADDALFLTTGGLLAEATSASLFLMEATGLATPSLDCGIIVSTTRQWLISAGGPRLGLAVRQGHLTLDDLSRADEVFLASSVAGILPVTAVDGRPVGDGKPGAWTMRLRALRESED
jgi:branched-chain amino acid aminotransferase